MTDQERLNELTDKFKSKGGFFALSKEEKEEYKAIKDKIDGNEQSEPEPIKQEKPASEKKIEVTESELEAIVSRAVAKAKAEEHVKDGKLFGKWEEFREADNNNQTATLKVWQPTKNDPRGIIVGQRELKMELNPRTGRNDILIYEIDVLYDDGKSEKLEADVETLIRINEIETVKLIENERKKLVKRTGVVNVTPKDKGGYIVRRADQIDGASHRGYEVEQEVHKYSEVFTVKRENGQTFKIDSIHLNN